MNANDEVYFCGHCRRQQQVSQGIKCIHCGKRTVSWNTRTETEKQALDRWKLINGQ